MVTSPDFLKNEFIKELNGNRVAFVLGTGVSLSTLGAPTPCGTWKGLLASGLTRCHDLTIINEVTLADHLNQVDASRTPEDLIKLASLVEQYLRAPSGEFTRWLADTVGLFRVNNPILLNAIRRFDATLLTTNYDTLVSQHFSLPVAPWTEEGRVLSVIRKEIRGVVHLHGVWSAPESIVFGETYQGIRGSESAQQIQKALALMGTFCFVGCGDGLEDPNVGALMRWFGQIFKNAEHRHYRLVTQHEFDHRSDQSANSRVHPIIYGNNYSDLPGWFNSLSFVRPTEARPFSSSDCDSERVQIHVGDVDISSASALPTPDPIVIGPPTTVAPSPGDNFWQPRLDHIKSLLDAGQIATARTIAEGLLTELQHSPRFSKGALFQTALYLSQSFPLSERAQASRFSDLAAENAPSEERAWRNRAVAHMHRQELDKALHAVDQAITLEPRRESSIIRCQVLATMGRYREASECIADSRWESDADVLYLRCFNVFRDGDPAAALQLADRAIALVGNRAHLLKIVGDCCAALVQTIRFETLHLVKSHRALAERGIAAYQLALEKLHAEQRSDRAAYLCNQAAIHTWLENLDRAVELFREADTLDPHHPIILSSLAKSLHLSGHDSECIDALSRLEKVSVPTSEMRRLRCDALVAIGDASTAEWELRALITDLPKDAADAIKARHALVRCLLRLQRTREAEVLCEQYVTEFKGNQEVLLLQAHVFVSTSRPQLAEATLLQLTGNSDPEIAIPARGLLIQQYFNHGPLHDARKAADLLASEYDPSINNNEAYHYAQALFTSGQIKTCLKVCREFQERHGPIIDRFCAIEAMVYHQNQEFETSARILHALVSRNPSNLEYHATYAEALLRSHHIPEAIDVLRQIDSRIGDDAPKRALLARAYLDGEQWADGLENAHKALKLAFDEPRMHVFYLFAFRRARPRLPNLGVQYVDTYQDCLQQFAVRFPGDDSIIEFKTSEDPKASIAPILELVRQRSERSRNVIQVYRDKCMPVGFLAKILGQHLAPCWSKAVTSASIGICSAIGHPVPIEAEKGVVQTSDYIVMDEVALLTVQALGLTHLLGRFKQVMVVQSIVDELQFALADLDTSAGESHMVLFEQDGQYYREEIPQAANEQEKSRYKNLLALIQSMTIIIGKSPERTALPPPNEEALSGLGEQYVESASEALARGAVLFAEDVMFRRVSEGLGIRTFGTHALVVAANISGWLSDEKTLEAIVGMMKLNYRNISISGLVLIHAVKSDGLTIGPASTAVINQLAQSNWDYNSNLPLIGSYLLWLAGNTPETICDRLAAPFMDILMTMAADGSYVMRNKHRVANEVERVLKRISPPTPGATGTAQAIVARWSIRP